MLKIGLTGGIASGKTTVCELFAQYGIEIIDADIIARELVQPGQPALTEIEQCFGAEYLSDDGQLNRPQLRQLIFSNAEAKHQLEAILHPKIRQRILKLTDLASSPYVILCVPLLIESQMQSLVDRIIVVNASEQSQLARLCSRDNVTLSQAKNMVDAQLSNQQRLAFADDIIDNENDQKLLAEKVEHLHKTYLSLLNLSK